MAQSYFVLLLFFLSHENCIWKEMADKFMSPCDIRFIILQLSLFMTQGRLYYFNWKCLWMKEWRNIFENWENTLKYLTFKKVNYVGTEGVKWIVLTKRWKFWHESRQKDTARMMVPWSIGTPSQLKLWFPTTVSIDVISAFHRLNLNSRGVLFWVWDIPLYTIV